MAWFKKLPERGAKAARQPDAIAPVPLELPFDEGLFGELFARLQQHMEIDVGAEAYLQALRAKHERFVQLLGHEETPSLTLEEIEVLLNHVFTARRRIFPVLEGWGIQTVNRAIHELLHGGDDLAIRLQAFAAQVEIPDGADREVRRQAQKLRRAMHDFGAELLHFSRPEVYPLMARWVWDPATVSGALREFIRGQEQMVDIPLGAAPGMFQGVRLWLANLLQARGLYRDIEWWVDLVMAEAYSTYFRAMAEGMLSADFGRSGGPEEHLKKFLGIDLASPDGRSRVKKAVLH